MRKPTRKQREAWARAQSDVTARAVDRNDIDYTTDELPTEHIARSSIQSTINDLTQIGIDASLNAREELRENATAAGFGDIIATVLDTKSLSTVLNFLPEVAFASELKKGGELARFCGDDEAIQMIALAGFIAGAYWAKGELELHEFSKQMEEESAKTAEALQWRETDAS
jgi:hypothetical protein